MKLAILIVFVVRLVIQVNGKMINKIQYNENMDTYVCQNSQKQLR